MAKNDNLKDFLTDVADAIRAKKGTSGLINPQNFSSEIASIETGGGGESGGGTAPVSSGNVTFYDYDGRILHSYTKDAFLALAELPELPTRQGLTCQGWNYELETAKAYVEEYGVLDIGATYITDDGKTRLYITIAAEGRMDVPICFEQTIANGVVVDWGDGSPTETFEPTSVDAVHHYDNVGDYVITLDVNDGNLNLVGSSSKCIMGSVSSTSSRVYPSMLKKVEVGASTSIATYAFYYCYSLSSVVIPNSVTSIGSNAFRSCTSLASVVIPNSVTKIWGYAFYYCCSLSSVVIPNSVTSIVERAFYYCYSLSSVVIPNSVTSIATYTFNTCSSLVSVVIPNSVTRIGNYTFGSCSSLASVVIPNSVTSIGNQAFFKCYSLSSVVIPNSVRNIGGQAFSTCYSLVSVVIPNSVTSIGSNAFSSCISLASVVIPNSVTSIGDNAFSSCTSLSSVVISNSVTKITDSVFTECSSLSSVVIPNSVTSIGNYVFSKCYGVSFYDFSTHESVPTLVNTNAFFNIASDCKIIVPDALYDSWIAASNWSTYASQIIKASEYNG